jgi:hypothetical protein
MSVHISDALYREMMSENLKINNRLRKALRELVTHNCKRTGIKLTPDEIETQVNFILDRDCQ